MNQDKLFSVDLRGTPHERLSATQRTNLCGGRGSDYEGNWKRLARREHPDTSKEAALEIARLGVMSGHALMQLRKRPGSTASELGDGSIRKRLNDLRIKGLARKGEKRKCRVTGRSAYTWFATERE